MRFGKPRKLLPNSYQIFASCRTRVHGLGWSPIISLPGLSLSIYHTAVPLLTYMFNGLHPMYPTDAELATQTLNEEGSCRFPSFSASDAVTLGLSIRKRFRSTVRHINGKGLVISIQTIAGHTLFACTVGDLGHASGVGDVSLDSWACLEGMVNIVKRTGHSSYYVEKGMSAMGKTPQQMGIQGESFRVNGGACPIWLENAPCCPIAVAVAYSGSSQEDHSLVSTTIRDYLAKLRRNSLIEIPPAMPERELPLPEIPPHEVQENMGWTNPPNDFEQRPQSPFNSLVTA